MTKEEWRYVMYKAMNFVDNEYNFMNPAHKDLARGIFRCLYRALE